MLVALAFVGLSLAGPPLLPPEGDVAAPEETPSEQPSEVAEPPAVEPPADAPDEGSIDTREQPPAEPTEDAPADTLDVPADPPSEDSAIPITPEPDPAPPSEQSPASDPPVQRPSGPPVTPTPVTPAPSTPATQPSSSPPAPVVAAQPDPEPQSQPPAAAADQQPEPDSSYRKLGGMRLFRVGVAAKIGYTHGTSDKNGLYDRDKSIQDSIDNMMLTTSGAGDLGQTKFGGFQYGFILDAEVIGINAWLDFHKFFRPGGMWSLLLGYDHEFGFGKRLRLDIGVAGGLNHVFLGKALSELYYDEDNPEAINIGTLGVEGRAMVDLHIKLVGPLFTGPYAMLGYHYLWSADAQEVTAEKGLHYSAGWSLRIDFAAPKLIGGRKRAKQ